MAKKPDNIVFNTETNSYDARLKEYGTNLGAPAIKIENLGPWKTRGIKSVNDSIAAEFEELRNKYLALQERYEYNQLVYSAEYNFKPIVGKTYYLYKGKGGSQFLSILKPNECSFDFISSFRLSSELVWEKVVE
ncbi:DUF2452 domain-containing protein [Muricauda sp. SCSIO 64092]|uniref:DUF2452 domain-containing protein n=1 Tax=Allomuricauda sp. SCSIO 64092 TaxID=2908842 RepID=UPI001FF6CA25|nr:DUF2452 domain-containing protein [Muricauda sp. SCSIO 64092]UOY08478.1 DUF2452 domain-containing protein [Muricauda sp. SCSIO 64092]